MVCVGKARERDVCIVGKLKFSLWGERRAEGSRVVDY